LSKAHQPLIIPRVPRPQSGSLASVSEGAVGRRGVYSIGAVARMLDLPVATIRNWEERYAAVVPERSAGGQRLYSLDQVEQLRYVASQVAGGLSAADAHRLLSEREAAGGPAPIAEPRDRARPLVLIAERDRAAAELVESVLRSVGYEVEPVFAAADAEERWYEHRPQLAIVELMISGGQGADLCRRLKRDGAGAVLAISVLEARDEALAAGADAFLQKPVDTPELIASVNDLLAASRRRDS
jgi:CheY-like chemotaxis protein